ncbi:MAG: lycopene cyclase domain-containing protein [bacterium]|nr:lycopene cyclase domain-containing protein [bacterium]
MSAYLLINIFIISIPLFLSFEKKIRFYKKIIPVIISIILTGIPFLIWDSIAVSDGDWSFNDHYLSGIKILNLPLEEIFFFITVPYSLLFLYECVRYYIKNKVCIKYFHLMALVSIIFLIAGFISLGRSYTSTVFFFCGVIFALIYIFNCKEFFSKQVLVTVLLSFIPFFIVNYLLTSLPVVLYNSGSITNFRLLTIPAEDVFYSLSMISSWLFIFISFEKFFEKKSPLN